MRRSRMGVKRRLNGWISSVSSAVWDRRPQILRGLPDRDVDEALGRQCLVFQTHSPAGGHFNTRHEHGAGVGYVHNACVLP